MLFNVETPLLGLTHEEPQVEIWLAFGVVCRSSLLFTRAVAHWWTCISACSHFSLRECLVLFVLCCCCAPAPMHMPLCVHDSLSLQMHQASHFGVFWSMKSVETKPDSSGSFVTTTHLSTGHKTVGADPFELWAHHLNCSRTYPQRANTLTRLQHERSRPSSLQWAKELFISVKIFVFSPRALERFLHLTFTVVVILDEFSLFVLVIWILLFYFHFCMDVTQHGHKGTNKCVHNMEPT